MSPNTPGVERSSLALHQYHSQVLVKEKREAGISQARAEWEVFCFYHEKGHDLSLTLARPVITKSKSLAAAIFGLLRPTGSSQCRGFWAEFDVRNRVFGDHLEKALALEELRATFHAFIFIHPDIRARIIPRLRKVMAEEGCLRLFDKLAKITNRNWKAAWCLTIYAEHVCGEEDPTKWLEGKCSGPVLRVDKNIVLPEAEDLLLIIYNPLVAQAMLQVSLSDDPVPKWRVDLGGSQVWEVDVNFIPVDVEGKTGRVYHDNSEEVKEAILLESLRQQLAQPSGLGLVCPFQHRNLPCCGYGHYVRGIWEHLPPEYRYPKFVINPVTEKKEFFRAPSKACLNYGLG